MLSLVMLLYHLPTKTVVELSVKYKLMRQMERLKSILILSLSMIL